MPKMRNSGQVIISATCFADASSAIEIATQLAKTLKMEIKAYIVEDESAYVDASLPFARAVSISGDTLKVTHSAMREAYLRDAETYEVALSNAARTSALIWSFERVKGQPETFLSGTRAKDDLVLFGFQKLQKQKGSIGIIQESKTPNPKCTKLGESLSRTLGLPTKTITVPTSRATKEFLFFLRIETLAVIIIPRQTALNVGISAILEASQCPVIVYDAAD